MIRGPSRVSRDKQKAQQQLGLTYEHVPCAVEVHDRSGRLLYRNQAAREMLGPAMSEPTGRGRSPRLVREDGSELPEGELPDIGAFTTSDSKQRVTIGVDRSDGQLLWLQADSVALKRADGKVAQVITTFADVTERLQAENRLRERVSLHTGIVETTPAAIAVTNAEGRFVYVNPSWCEMTGFLSEEAAGLSVFDLVPESERASAKDRTQSRLQGITGHYRTQARRKDGSYFWAHIDASPFRNARGEVVGSLAIIFDISEWKYVETALGESEARSRATAEQLQRVIDTMADAIVISDLEGRAVSWNQGAQRMFGWLADEAFGQVSAGAAPEQVARAAERRRWVVETGKDLVYESAGVTADGRKFPVLGTLSPLRNDGGQIDRLLGVFKDLSSHKQLEEQAKRLALMEERTRIGREIHDSVSQVLGYVNTKAQAVAELLRLGNISQGARQIEDLAAAARDSYADVREAVLNLRIPSSTPHSLTDGLREYVDRWSPEAGVTIALRLPPQGLGDLLSPMAELQLLLIIQEALSNVRKHARARRAQIQVAVRRGNLETRIEDDGVGLRADPKRDPSLPRLGLVIMRERAEGVGGTFAIGPRPSGGTRVTVRLPRAGAEPVRHPVRDDERGLSSEQRSNRAE